jgi:hypothetical protein
MTEVHGKLFKHPHMPKAQINIEKSITLSHFKFEEFLTKSNKASNHKAVNKSWPCAFSLFSSAFLHPTHKIEEHPFIIIIQVKFTA